jgi:bifunctional non-homologous end joining protein LigD
MKSAKAANFVYYLFDLLYLDGHDLRKVPLGDRKELLRALVPAAEAGGRLRFSEHIIGRGETVYEHACRLGLEGVISKRADSAYEHKRTRSWLKSKCSRRQEFVIGGYSDPSGARSHFGALLLGYYEKGKLIYCGRVGTGFNERTLKASSEN